jgi:hypothetical protein
VLLFGPAIGRVRGEIGAACGGFAAADAVDLDPGIRLLVLLLEDERQGEPDESDSRGAASEGSAATSQTKSIENGKTTPAATLARIRLSIGPPAVGLRTPSTARQ